MPDARHALASLASLATSFASLPCPPPIVGALSSAQNSVQNIPEKLRERIAKKGIREKLLIVAQFNPKLATALWDIWCDNTIIVQAKLDRKLSDAKVDKQRKALRRKPYFKPYSSSDPLGLSYRENTE